MDFRRRPLLLLGIVALTLVAVIGGVLTSGGADIGFLLIMAGILLGFAGLAAVLLWVIKARTGSVSSPLLGLPAGVRKRVAGALREQQPLADEEEQRLALDEARRVRRATPLTVPVMTLATLVMSWGLYVRLTDDDRDLTDVGLSVVSVVCFAFLTAYHLVLHWRSGAYLDRYAVPHQRT